ncbi:hypothetical protein PENTCL1PPCAC_19834, partial [Pristionchus entomophagus]
SGMEPPEASLETVEGWQKKSSVLVGQSEDGIVSILNKAFDVMALFHNKRSTDKNIRLALAHLQVERSLNLQYEKIGNDSTRDLMYGLIESLQLTLSELVEGRNGTKETGVVCRISVEDWLRKSVELCIQTDDGLISVIKNTLEAIVTIRNKKSDEKSIRLALAHLEVERSLTVQYESSEKDPVRHLFFGFIECIHLTLSRVVDDRNQVKVTKEVSTESTEPLLSPPDLSYKPFIRSTGGLSTNRTFPLDPKEEPFDFPNTYPRGYELVARDFLKDPMILKDEVMSDEEMPELTADFMEDFMPGEEPILIGDGEDILSESLVSIPPHYTNRAPIARNAIYEEDEKNPLKKTVDASIVDARTNRGFLGSSSGIVFKPVKIEVNDKVVQPPLKKSKSVWTEENKSITLDGAHTKNRLIPVLDSIKHIAKPKQLCVIGVKRPVYPPNSIVRGSTVPVEEMMEVGHEKGGQKLEQMMPRKTAGREKEVGKGRIFSFVGGSVIPAHCTSSPRVLIAEGRKSAKNALETDRIYSPHHKGVQSPAHSFQLSPIRRKCRKFTPVVVESSDEEDSDEEDWLIVCICGQTEEDGEEMVQCDKCLVRWEHVDCIFPRTKKAPMGDYTCHVCQPR